MIRRGFYRDPGEAEAGGGTAVAEALSLDTPPHDASASQTDTPAGEGAPAPAPSDSDLLAAAQAKFDKDPNYQFTDEELAAYERSRDGIKAEAPKEGEKPPEQKPAETPDPLKPVLEKVGAKTLEDLGPKVEGLLKELDRLNGERGKLGQLDKFQTTLEKQNAFMMDFFQGKPEALEYARIKFGWTPPQGQQGRAEPQRQAQQETVEDEDIIDTALHRRMSKEIADLKETVKSLTAQAEQVTQARELELAREQAINEIGALVQEFPELYDAKQHGPIAKAMAEYYHSKANDPVNPAIQQIVDIMHMAAQNGLRDLRHAYAIKSLERRPQDIIQARREAAQRIAGHKPTVGLSDQQQAQGNGRKDYTEADLNAIVKSGNIPDEWMDPQTGALIPSKLPPALRAMYETRARA